MGAKTWMLVSSDGPARELLAKLPRLNRAASLALAQKMFPGERLAEQEDGDLLCTNPDEDELFVGCFDGVAVVAAEEFGVDYPSQLPEAFIKAMPHKTVVLHAMHSAVGWFAYAIWQDGKLVRSLSLSPDAGVLEDIGERQSFELPYWSGERPLYGQEDEDDGEGEYPLIFHPLEMAESALGALFGYVLEGDTDEALFEADELPLMTFSRKKADHIRDAGAKAGIEFLN